MIGRVLALAIALAGGDALAQAVAPPPRPATPPPIADAAGDDPAVAPEPAPLRAGVALMGLDKFSALADPFAAPIGEAVSYERLFVTVRACESGPQGDVAWLVVVDTARPEAPVFRGWMFAASPALSSMDHPRYDVWLTSCSTRSADAS